VDATAEELFGEGTRLARNGRLGEAIETLRHAVALRPDLAEAHFNLGGAYRDHGDAAQAIEAYRRAVELRPRWVDARLALGTLLREHGDLDAAVEQLSRAVELQPDAVEAHMQLGHAYTPMGEWRAAVSHLQRASALQPDDAKARWAAVMAQIPALDEPGVEVDERRSAFATELARLADWLHARPRPEAFAAVAVHQPFFLAYQEKANRELLAPYGRLCTGLMRDWQARAGFAPPAPRAGGPIRIGIVSAHVLNHSVWTALGRGWMERLTRRRLFRRRRYELHLFHLGAQRDAETQFAQSRVARFEQGQRGFEDWARRIHAAALDVLVYPEVGMDATSAKLAALRLAPVQALSWGHPETSGLPTMDYYISAAALEPPDAESNYTERLEMLPALGCWIARRPRPIAQDAALPAGRPCFVCPGTPFKYTARHDRILTAIAARVPGCRFLFFRSQPPPLARKLEARLRRAFERARLDFERHVAFLPWQDLASFRGVLAQADLYLDTLGFSGFNTALQALECGLPIVACEGRFMRGRFASGMLKHIGLAELVAASDDAYIELAVALATDAARRAELRRRIAREREALYEDARPVAALEAFIERVARG
jgi:protein O-GlcNAc transferase